MHGNVRRNRIAFQTGCSNCPRLNNLAIQSFAELRDKEA